MGVAVGLCGGETLRVSRLNRRTSRIMEVISDSGLGNSLVLLWIGTGGAISGERTRELLVETFAVD